MNKFVPFALGLVAGALGAGYFWKQHYKKQADEEIQSVVETFGAKKKTEEKKEQPEKPQNDISMNWSSEQQSKLQKYTSLVRDEGYVRQRSPKERLEDISDKPHPGDMVTKPYAIDSEDFDTLDDYEAICYTYYADGILVDEDDEPLTTNEIAWSVGLDFAAHFGDYDEDSVHIRNDMRQTDYEIVRDLRKYEDLHGTE
jgi:hypothetical protein